MDHFLGVSFYFLSSKILLVVLPILCWGGLLQAAIIVFRAVYEVVDIVGCYFFTLVSRFF